MAREIAFREDLALLATPAHVRGVHARTDKVDVYGIAFTLAEATEIAARQRTADEVTKALRSMKTRMPAATFAGEFLDNATGRVVVRVTGGAAGGSPGATRRRQ